jgi:anti-anti-sigma factor
MPVTNPPFVMTSTATRRWVISVTGEVDLATGLQLVTAAEKLVAQGRPIDFDLSRVTFIDSAGWAAVRFAARAVDRAGAVARISNPSLPVRRIMALVSRVPPLGPLDQWVEAAGAACAPGAASGGAGGAGGAPAAGASASAAA